MRPKWARYVVHARNAPFMHFYASTIGSAEAYARRFNGTIEKV